MATRLVRHASEKGPTRLVISLNAQIFVLARKIPPLADVIQRAEEVTLDGISVCTGVRLLTDRKVDRIQGVDMVSYLCEQAAPYGLRVMLLGGRPGAAEQTRSLLAERCPGLTLGVNCPPVGFDRSEETLEQVRESIRSFAPDILFVAFGAPKQELFMERQIRPLNVPVVMAVGGSFEMISGMVRRAPVWLQNIGMEWFFRMLVEPRRLLWRYVSTNTIFLWALFSELISDRFGTAA
ncbi:MAG: WecB/TagA/CpsF family glycosyltransferase [Terriglobus sp.]